MSPYYCCSREMKCHRNEVNLVYVTGEAMPWGIRHADAYICRTCERVIIAGCAPEFWSEIGRDGRDAFAQELARLGPGAGTGEAAELLRRTPPVVVIPDEDYWEK